MRDSSTAVLKQWTGVDNAIFPLATTVLWGSILLLLMLGAVTSLVRKFLSRNGLPLVVLSLLWLTYYFIGATAGKGWANFWATEGTGATSFLSSIDLVIAMPVSWLPLVTDYARSQALCGKNEPFRMDGRE
jgi:nucleobase:cation symporter-1, NCS1 family